MFGHSRREQTLQPAASVHRTRQPRRPSHPHPRRPSHQPTTHMLPHDMPKEANGTAVTLPPSKNVPDTLKNPPRVSVTFKGGSDTHIDSHSCTVNMDDHYAPWQPLQPQFPSNYLSRSCQEITQATSSSMTRSASAGNIPSMAEDEKQAKEKEEVVADVTSKRRHRSEVHRPLMWQASVDHLTPVGRRRKSEMVGREQMKPGQTHTHTHSHLKVRTMIKNFRRSFSDLFNIEEH